MRKETFPDDHPLSQNEGFFRTSGCGAGFLRVAGKGSNENLVYHRSTGRGEATPDNLPRGGHMVSDL